MYLKFTELLRTDSNDFEQMNNSQHKFDTLQDLLLCKTFRPSILERAGMHKFPVPERSSTSAHLNNTVLTRGKLTPGLPKLRVNKGSGNRTQG